MKENRHLARAAEAQATQAAQKDTVRLKAAVNAIINDPAANNLSMQESEQYFLEHVAMGESLANKGPLKGFRVGDSHLPRAFRTGPQFEVEAAVAFFKALKVYPAPHELIQIYQRTLPEKVFANIMTCFGQFRLLYGLQWTEIGLRLTVLAKAATPGAGRQPVNPF